MRILPIIRLKDVWIGLAGASLICLASPAFAENLLAAYRAALKNDPAYQAAVSEHAAGLQNRDIARSNLLPNASASAGYSDNRGDRRVNGGNPSPLSYDSKVMSVSVRQPLYSVDAMARYRQGGFQADYADAIFSGKSQDLIVRLVAAYLDVLAAGDQQRLTVAQRNALGEQQLLNRSRYEKGEGTKTDVLETNARFELANAVLIEAQDTLDNAQRKLQTIVGKSFTLAALTLSKNLSLTMQPSDAESWERLALEHSPDIRARRYLAEVATQEVRKNEAGHLPRLDLVASHSRSVSESIILLDQTTTLTSVGVQLSVPIYSGGAVSASVRQSADLLGKSQAELDDAINGVLVEVRKQFNLVASGRARIEALEQAESSAIEALEATRKSIQGGVRINLDLLNAIQQLFTTRRDLAQARYGYLLAYVRLHDAAGLLNEGVVDKLSEAFATP